MALSGTPRMGNMVGVSCLMYAVTLSHGLRQMMCARRGCALLAESNPSPVSPYPPHHKPLGLATLTKLNTEMRICRTKFGILTLILIHIQCVLIFIIPVFHFCQMSFCV